MSRDARLPIRHAWLQKHPSPVASGGEFHWYPRDGDRELRASCVERLRGVDPPAVLWELAPGRVVWAEPFAAIAPHDRRRYVGLVVTIVELEGGSPAQLLREVTPPPAAPFVADELDAARAAQGAIDDDAAGVARSLLSGGTARLGSPNAPWIASLEAWMPDSVTARTRRGVWSSSAPASKQPDRVAELVTSAWGAPTSYAARAWRLLVELAEARGQTVDEVDAELAAIDLAPLGALTDEERAAMTGKHEFVDALHAWGRGVLDQCPTAGTLTTRLADAVALRVLAQLVDGRDARDAIAQARWYALLPTARRKSLLEAVAERAVSLRGLVEVTHA